MNMNHDALGDRRGDSILSKTQVGASISAGQLAQCQAVSFYAVLH